MPRYRITDPQTGRTLLVEGDGEPTDQEADELFAQTPAEPAKKDPVPAAQEVVDRYANSMVKGLSYLNPVMPSWVMKPLMDGMGAQDAAKAMLTRGGAVGDIAAQVVPSVGGSIIGSFGGPLGTVAGGAIGATAGDSLKQAREILRGEKESVNVGELASNTILGGIPAFKLAPGATALKALAVRTGQGAAMGAGGSVIEDVWNGEKPQWGKLTQGGAVGAGLGFILGVPEAIALRKLFGGKAALEGKTVAKAADEIALEQGVPPATILERINEATGVSKKAAKYQAEDSARVFQEQGGPMGYSAQDSAEVLATEAVKQSRELQFNLARSEEALLAAKQAALTATPEYRGPSVPVNNAPQASVAAPKLSSQAQRMYDEFGGVNPQALMPIAQAALGGVIGGATGDTPEQRVRNALIGAGVAISPQAVAKLVNMVKSTKVAEPVMRAAKEAKTSLALRFNPASVLPEEIRKELRIGEQEANAAAFLAISRSKDILRAIEETGHIGTQGVTAKSVDEYLKGNLPLNQLPLVTQVPAEKARILIDDMTDAQIKAGIVDGKLAKTFMDNKGSYVRRSFEAFLNPSFKFDPVKEQALIGAIMKGGQTEKAAKAVVGEFKRKSDAAVGFIGGNGKLGAMDVTSLIKRQELIPEALEFLGEIRDPMVNVTQTISRMGRTIAMDAAQKRVREVGFNLGIFKGAQDNVFTTPLAGDVNGPMGGLAGIHTTPEIAEAYKKVARNGSVETVPGVLYKAFASLTSAAKASKTVWNPKSYAPNLIGGLVTNVANGNFRLDKAGTGLRLGAEEIGFMRSVMPNAPSREALTQDITELTKLGVFGESVNQNDLRNGLEKSFIKQYANKASKFIDVPAQIYGGIDNFTKYIGFKSEQARQSWVHPGMPETLVKQRAAERVTKTMPTYSRIPKWVKDASTTGLMPQFIAFRYETFRNTFNTAKIGFEDIAEGTASGNSRQVADGARRIAGLTTVLSVAGGTVYSAAELAKQKLGISQEQENAARYYAAPWDRNGVNMFTGPISRGGKVSFANLSYLIPQATFWEPVMAARQGKTFEESVGLFFKQMAGEWYGDPTKESIILGSATGALLGRDPRTGRDIPKTDIEPTFGDRISWGTERALKPLVVDFAENTRKAIKGEMGDYGKTYSLAEQGRNLLGIRESSYDPLQAVKWKTKELSDNMQGAAEIYRTRQGRNLTPDQNEQYYQMAETARQKVFAELQVAKRHAISLEVTADQFTEAMRAAKITPILITGINDGGEYTPMSRDKNEPAHAIAEALRGKSGEQVRQELARIHLEEGASRTKSVISEYRSMVRDDARGVTSREEVMRSIPAEDRADYINRRLEKLQTTEERQQYIRELSARGVITPEVRLRMMGRN